MGSDSRTKHPVLQAQSISFPVSERYGTEMKKLEKSLVHLLISSKSKAIKALPAKMGSDSRTKHPVLQAQSISFPVSERYGTEMKKLEKSLVHLLISSKSKAIKALSAKMGSDSRTKYPVLEAQFISNLAFAVCNTVSCVKSLEIL